MHNKLEKNRRAHLKECFELLKSQVPAIQDEKKPSNLTILRTAIRYVQVSISMVHGCRLWSVIKLFFLSVLDG